MVPDNDREIDNEIDHVMLRENDGVDEFVVE